MHKSVAVLASAVLLGSATFGAQAADLIVSPKYEAEPAQVVSAADPFTGAYIGGTLGVVTSDSFDGDLNRATAGAQVGYQQQFGAFVLGAEAEALYLNDLEYRLSGTGGLKQNWSLAAKARAGVAIDHTLLYGTLGYGITSFEGYGDATTSDDVKGGVVFGAGIEQAFSDTVSARVEYLQSRYDGVESVLGGTPRSDDLTNHAIKLGVNFHF